MTTELHSKTHTSSWWRDVLRQLFLVVSPRGTEDSVRPDARDKSLVDAQTHGVAVESEERVSGSVGGSRQWRRV